MTLPAASFVSDRADQKIQPCTELIRMENRAVTIRENAGDQDGVFRTTRGKASEYGESVASAVTSMDVFVAALNETRARLTTSPPEGVKVSDVQAAIRDLSRAITFASEQKGKVDDVLRQERGGDGIDFDAARAEIGRRLDSIRKAAGEGDVPERADG